MAKVAKIDRAGLEAVKKAMMDALKPLEAELGVTFTMGRGRYGNAEKGSTEVEFVCAAPDGTAQSVGEVDFRRHAAALGLKPDDFGRSFVAQGTRYTIAGLVPSSRKYPILGERADGKRFKFTLDTITLAFKAEAAAAEAKKREEAEEAERKSNAETKRVMEAAAAAKAEREREAAEAAEEETWVAPPRAEPISNAAKAMQDRLFG